MWDEKRFRTTRILPAGSPAALGTKGETMTTIKDIADTFGLTMIDADQPLEVEVKPCDVKGSKAHNQTDCAIARAVKRQYGAQDVYVLRSTVWVSDGDHLVRYSLPGSLQKEIVSFDRNRDFRPGKYRLAKKTLDPAAHAAAQRRYYQKTQEAKAAPAETSPPKAPKPKAVKQRKLTPAKPVTPAHRGVIMRAKHETEGIRSSDLDRYDR